MTSANGAIQSSPPRADRGSDPEPEQHPPQPPRSPSVTHRTASGFVWLLIQTVLTKGAGMAGQLVLAWFLRPQDFGLIGLAYTVSAFATLIQQGGIREILIQRQHFLRRANPAFWMSLVLGLASGLLMAGAAPFAAAIFAHRGTAPHSTEEFHQLVNLILILAVTAPLNALAIVPSARQGAEMRFRDIAAINLAGSLATVALNIVLAWMGWGVYSFVLPLPLVAIARTAALWIMAPVPVRGNPQLRRWRFLVGDSGLLFLSSIFFTILAQGDYMTLGVMHSATVVGIYFFAFNLSMQTMMLLTLNLGFILFSALSSFSGDRERQTRAFLRAARLLTLVGIPLCLLQAAVATPAIHLFFKAKWYPAIPVFQVLSIGTAFRIAGSPSGNLTQAQGRFKTLLVISIAYASLFLLFVFGGAKIGEALSVAVAVALFFAIADTINIYIAIYPGGGTWRDVSRLYYVPLPASVAAMLLGMGAVALLPHRMPLYDVAALCIITLISMGSYAAIIRSLAPEDWRELTGIVGSLLRRGRGGVVSSASAPPPPPSPALETT